jgi:hypothetical protein
MDHQAQHLKALRIVRALSFLFRVAHHRQTLFPCATLADWSFSLEVNILHAYI